MYYRQRDLVFFQFIRYNLVGIINTIAGFSIIFLLMFIGLSATLSNAIGYAIGSILSFYLNSRYTFKSTRNSKSQIFKFFTILGVSYILNFITLQWLLGFVNPYIAQIGSAIVYTVNSFLMVKFIVFKDS
ncbi:MAG TPA: GtrA family protein [Campylobacterales bacterium]|nr:GtrA family protein [Campylobacterales bacterium]